MNDFAGRHLHTVDYVDAAEFAGQDVVVVGGGTSAIGFLMELEDVTEVAHLGGRAADRVPRGSGAQHRGRRQRGGAAGCGGARGPRAAEHRVDDRGAPHPPHPGRHRSRPAPRAADVQLDRAGWRPLARRRASSTPTPSSGATGFRPELRHLAPLKLREKEGGIGVGGGAWRTRACSSPGTGRRRPRSARTARGDHRAPGRRDAQLDRAAVVGALTRERARLSTPIEPGKRCRV